MAVYVCVFMCVCYDNNSKIIGQSTLTYVAYENDSDELDIGHCLIKVKVKVTA